MVLFDEILRFMQIWFPIDFPYDWLIYRISIGLTLSIIFFVFIFPFFLIFKRPSFTKRRK